MDQKHELIKQLEEENKALKEQLSRSEADRLQVEYVNKILKYNKEVVAVIAYDGKGTVEDISDGISSYGYSPDEFTSGELSYWDIVCPDDLEELKKNIEKKSVTADKGFGIDHRIHTKNGKLIWVMATAMPVVGAFGNVERHVVKINNINKRKKYEEELSDTNENLFMTLKSIGEAVILLDADGYINRLNAAAEKMIGIISLKAKNKPLHEVVRFSYSPDISTLVDPLSMEAETRKMVQLDEVFMQCPYNAQYRVSCNISPIILQKSKLAGYVMVIKDLTAIYNMLQTVKESEQELKNKLESLLSDDMEVNDARLIDIIPVEQLQALQDKFSVANGVSSVITDLNNVPITRPSNFNDVCTSVFYSGEECYQIDRIIRNVASSARPCKLIDAKAPIYIGDKHVADWKIGMCGFGGVVAPFVKAACESNEKFSATYARLQGDIRAHFIEVCDLLEIMANEISNIGYKNVKLAHELIKGKENEAKLAESETTMRSIFDNSVDGIILIDSNGIVKEWSFGYETLSGISKKQAIGKPLWDVVMMILAKERYSDREIEEMRTQLDAVIFRREQTVVTRHIIHRKTKKERITHTLYFPVQLPGGTMIGAISRDATEDIKNEQRLIENNALLEGIMDTIPVPVFVKDENGSYIKFNDAFLKTFDLHSDQVAGSNVSQLFPKVASDVEDTEKRLLSGNKLTPKETSIETVFGERDGIIYRNAFFDVTGKAAGIVGVIFDTTDLKNAERELIAEKERLQSLGDNFPNGCLFRFVFDTATKKMRIAYLSETWEDLSGIPKEEALRDVNAAFGKIVPEDLPLYLQAVEKSVATLSRFNVEIRLGDNDNNIKWIQISSQPRLEGEYIICDGFMLDITDRKTAEQELIAEKERLQALGDNYPDGCLFRATLDIRTEAMRITYMSKPWEKLSGGIPVEAVVEDIHVALNKVYPDDLPKYLSAIRESARTMTNMNVEIRFMFEDELVKWVQVSSHPHREDDLVIWDGFILDITARKTTELKLEVYREDLEVIVRERTEEIEATNEELYAANEELYATNEEFAVINEELQQKNDLLQSEMAARKEVMQRLENSESKMRNFIEQSYEGIVILDEEGKVIEWNAAQERITEIPREKAIGQFSWDLYKTLMPEKTAEQKTREFRESILSCLQAGVDRQSEESEHKFTISDNNERYITIVSFPIGLADTCYLGEIVRDVTEQKLVDFELERYRTQLEDMVAAQTKELTISKERLTSLSDNLPGGVIYQMQDRKDIKAKFTYVSAKFADMFRIGVNEVMNDSGLFFNLIHPDDREKLKDLFAVTDEAGFIDMECRTVFDKDDIKWIHLRSSYHIAEDGMRVWDGFMVDITDKKNADRELEESRKRQNILIKVLQIVQSSENISQAINIALSEIGKYAGVSRSYIFEKSSDGRTADNTYEWCNEGVTPEIENLQKVPIEFMSDWFEAFDSGGYICVSDIRDLSPTAYEQLSPQGIKSILVLPLTANGTIYGFVGFDECSRYMEWQQKEVELLISLSQIISSTARRYRAEKAMELSRQTMRTVLDNVNASIYVADFDSYEVLFANKTVKDQMGYDIEGKKCWQVIQKGKTAPCDFCPNPKLLDEKKQPTGLYRWEFQNENTRRWYECTDAAIEWVDGRLVHMEYATDVTDRREAEEALRQSEDLYRQLTVASPDAIVVCDPKGKVILVSPKAKELFLIDDDSDIGKLRLTHFVHPHDMRKSLEMFRSFVRDTVVFMPQMLLMRRDGTDFFGEISSASVKDDHGKTTSVIMVIRDITDRKLSEMELVRAKEKAEESDKLKSAFLANMSHEIRTPINGIIGFLNFLADDNLTPKRRQEYITVVNNSSVQLVKLIDDIIDVAKIEAKQMNISPVPFRINELMRELHVFFETYLHANNKDRIALILDDSEFVDTCVTYVDPMRLRQVLTNLMGNAIKFTEKGYIRFGYRQSAPDKLEFTVEDSGIGLAKDQLEVIFERFRQAELTNSRRYGGTGLGLTISRSLVQMMGGDITVESIEGEGSTFRFTVSYLPVGNEDEQKFENFAPGEKSDNKPFKNKTVLVVAPEVMRSKYYEKLLSFGGAGLTFAQTMAQWIDVIGRRKDIDAVLADARIFENETDETIKQVKSVRAGLPLILVVPERNEYYHRLIADSRCNKVIEGTVDYATLCTALKRYL